MSEAAKNRRDRAAAARDEANAGEKRRERMVRIVGAVTVLVVVVGIIGVALIAKNSQNKDAVTSSATVDPNAPLPKGVLPTDDARAYGVPYGTAAADAPVLEIWEDFQCPACGAVEEANGPGIAGLAADGTVQLVWRPTTFLDRNLGNDASERAVAAWGCAIDLGKSREYHDAVYANRPANEGDGFTDDQLIKFAGVAGIEGADLDTFRQCFDDRTYLNWSANSTDIFYSSNVAGTPYALLNGVELPTATLIDQAALEKAVSDAAAGITPSPASSPAASPAAS
jgi:protein-disulfide isomerase